MDNDALASSTPIEPDASGESSFLSAEDSREPAHEHDRLKQIYEAF